MRLHLIESDQRSLQTAECAFASLVFHASLVWFALGVIAGAQALSEDERLTMPLALLPPDRRLVASGWASGAPASIPGRLACHPVHSLRALQIGRIADRPSAQHTAAPLRRGRNTRLVPSATHSKGSAREWGATV